VAKDMIAVRIGPNLRLAVVGAPLYFDRHTVPRSPQDLTEHDCINLRLPTYGDLYVLEFEKDGQAVNVRVQGQLAFNSSTPRVRAALAEFGLAFVPEDMVLDHVKDGKLVRVLEDWCPSSPVITPTIRAAGSSLRRSNWSLTPCARAFELTGLYCQSGLAPVPRVPSFRYA
jgi:DNA-binding transcriptional LysR family regulator